ncbi:hypothetical protein BLA29_006718 [Euroglyphus maynei]|uniref:CCHC-type domain-containing protein n=1 Tax=Euroglyphus maynei TaxID=6958 RepID=A0A1Y3BPJ0_EURMA|nr:hypothetical protein BLA29_006718 [Euroglyphus maynei]
MVAKQPSAPSKEELIVSIPNIANSSITKQTIAKSIIPSKNNIRVKDVKKLTNGKVKIAFDSPNSKNQFIDQAGKSVDPIHYEEPRSINPIVYIKGIDKSVNIKDIPQLIVSYNTDIADHLAMSTSTLDESLVMKFRRSNRKEHLYNAAIQVTPAIRNIIMNTLQGKINIEYDFIHVEDLSPLVQCYTCNGFNHISSKCPDATVTCSYCAGSHSFKVCPNKNGAAKCSNCSRVGHSDCHHSAIDRNCPIYQRMLTKAFSRVKYTVDVSNYPDIHRHNNNSDLTTSIDMVDDDPAAIWPSTP